MRSALHVVVLGLFVACAEANISAPAQAPQPKAANQLRVMSYNVNFSLPGDASSMEAIALVDADVVFLQETNDEWKHALVLRFGAEYPHQRYFPPDPDGNRPAWRASGMGVMSKYPIVSFDKLKSPGGLFFAARIELDTNVGRIQAINVHLRPPMTNSGNYVIGYFMTNGHRLHEIEHYVESLDPMLPTLIVGDFNEDSSGYAVKYLLDHGYADAVHELNGGTRTWEWPLGDRKLRLQLDHLIHDAQLIPTAGAIVNAGSSDHKPVWADFERMQP